MTLKFQLNIDTTGLTPSQLAAAIQTAGRDVGTLIAQQSSQENPTIERHQCAPVYAGSELVGNLRIAGNWRVITS